MSAVGYLSQVVTIDIGSRCAVYSESQLVYHWASLCVHVSFFRINYTIGDQRTDVMRLLWRSKNKSSLFPLTIADEKLYWKYSVELFMSFIVKFGPYIVFLCSLALPRCKKIWCVRPSKLCRTFLLEFSVSITGNKASMMHGSSEKDKIGEFDFMHGSEWTTVKCYNTFNSFNL